MPKLKALSLTVGGLLLLSSPTFANVTVVNETDQTHTITFDHGHDEVKHEIEPNGTVEEACPEQCGVRFSGHDYIATDGETLAITEGSTRPVRKGG